MKPIILDSCVPLTIEDVSSISRSDKKLCLSPNPDFKRRIEGSAQRMRNVWEQEEVIYGVTTGYGENCSRSVGRELMEELPGALVRFHGCGMGALLSEAHTRGVLAVRLASLCKGYSGVSFGLLEALVRLLDKDILPCIPEEGSVGASGDLTPLSYVAAVLMGKREVHYEGKIQETKGVYEALGISPYQLKPKEALAIMNGTSVMTALAVDVYRRAHYLVRFAARLTALTSLVLEGNKDHFHPKLFDAKPHEGQSRVAALIRSDLGERKASINRLQDRYSTRCAPHVIGVLEDMLPTFKRIIETEINSANDNPLVDLEEDLIYHGGHFYGGHVGFVMDSLKILAANVADLLDRQLAVLTDPKMGHGLPSNLSGATGERASINHGLKALGIATSAWAAEALKGTMPASVFSRSTESHNQDKVSMGTIAARDALRLLTLTEQVACAHLIGCVQGIRLRQRMSGGKSSIYEPGVKNFLHHVDPLIPFIDEDQRLDGVLQTLMKVVQDQAFNFYEEGATTE